MAITVTRDRSYPRIKGGTRRADFTITLDDDYPGTERGYDLSAADLGFAHSVKQVWIQPIIDAAAGYLARYDIENERLVILKGAADTGAAKNAPDTVAFSKNPDDVGASETDTPLALFRAPFDCVVKSIAVYAATYGANVAIDCEIDGTSCLDAAFAPANGDWATGTIDAAADDVTAGDEIVIEATSDGTGFATGLIIILTLERNTSIVQGGTGGSFVPVADASSDLDGLEVKMHAWGS